MSILSKERKKNKRKLMEEAAERLAQILILQVELSKSNAKDTTITSQKKYENKN